MATSGSLEKRREKKPESVQFWLAITAGSLLLHSLFMFGVSRSIKVSVVEPDAAAIDVEMVDASDFKSAPSEEPIVPAVAFKPESFKPEPTPLPESSPEPALAPTPEPSVKSEPIVKPEVKKNPMAPTPKISSTPKAIRSPSITPPTIPIPRLPDLDESASKTRSFIASNVKLEQLDTGGIDQQKATLVLSPPFPALIMSSDFAKDLGKTIVVSLTFVVECADSQGLVCPSDQIKISYSSHNSAPPIDREPYFSELDDKIKAWTTKLKASSLVYQTDPLGKTNIQKKPATYWNIQVSLQVKN